MHLRFELLRRYDSFILPEHPSPVVRELRALGKVGDVGKCVGIAYILDQLPALNPLRPICRIRLGDALNYGGEREPYYDFAMIPKAQNVR